IDFILRTIVPLKFYRRIYIIPYLEVFSTGSIFLTRAVRKYIKLFDNKINSLWILSENEVTKYVIHYTGRSWHSFDGFVFNQIDANPISFSFILLFFISFIFIVFKHHHYVSKYIKLK
ncbi:unnamed protein product, partial [Rotaria sp. Silwood1]